MSLYVVLTTVDSGEKAEEIARLLVERRVAACVSISSPITSFYRWQGKLEQSREWMLIIKTPDYRKLQEELLKIHPYQVPEFIVLKAEHVLESYLNWALSETQG